MHKQISPTASPTREARLCFLASESPAQIPDVLRGGLEMLKNPEIKTAREAYEEFLRVEHQELLTQPDRTYFLALVTNEMLLSPWGERGQDQDWGATRSIEYGTYQRDHIRAPDPFDLGNRENMAEVVEEKRRERELAVSDLETQQDSLDDAVALNQSPADQDRFRLAVDDAQRALDTATAALTEAEARAAAQGTERTALQGAQDEWVSDGKVDHDAMEKTVQQYLAWREELNGILHQYGLRVPNLQSADTTWAQDDLLREEYFNLLVLVSQGKTAEVATAAEKGMEALRKLLKTEEGHVGRAERVYRELLVDEIGSAEVLNAHGILIGPDVRNAYWNLRKGTVVAEAITSQAPGMPPIAPGLPLHAGESAAAWIDNPMLAWEFLSKPETGFPATESNRKFLDALQWHFDTANRGGRTNPPELSKEAAKASLELIVQSLLEYERVLGNSARERTAIKTSENIGQTIERHASGVWEYMKEYRDHPLGSALAAAAAFVVIRKMYRFIFKEDHNNAVTWMVRGGLFGLALGLYQKHTSGKAWWDSAWNGIEQWRNKDRQRPEGEQTLPGYWAAECEISDPNKRACLLLLEEQDSKEVLDWYGRMDQATLRSDVKSTTLPADLQLPFRVDGATRERLFGQKSNAEIARLFYGTLREFFINRGRAVQKEVPLVADRYGIRDPASIGYRYIYDKYVSRRLVESLAGPTISRTTLDIQPITYTVTDRGGDRSRTTTLVPGISAVEQHRTETYLAQESEQDMAHWPMWNIFLLEADPAALRRMGREAAMPASVLEQLQYKAVEIAGYGRIWITEAIDTTSDMFRNLTASLGPVLRRLPGTIVRVTTQGGRYVVEVLTSAGAALGTYTYNAGENITKEIYALHGIPKDKFEKFQGNEQYIENIAHNGRNAGLRVSVLGTKKVAIGQFDSIPFTDDGPALTLDPVAFADADTAQLNRWVEEWRRITFIKKQASLQEEEPGFVVALDADTEWVRYDRGNRIPALRAKSSFYEWVRCSNENIKQAFVAWESGPATPDTDPLQ